MRLINVIGVTHGAAAYHHPETVDNSPNWLVNGCHLQWKSTRLRVEEASEVKRHRNPSGFLKVLS